MISQRTKGSYLHHFWDTNIELERPFRPSAHLNGKPAYLSLTVAALCSILVRLQKETE